ncbi:hypothetical protein EDB86DRAFT_3248296 [Lactarius hatsudake]|nr:hypothetical protein EDB86DRAFT_3248296 [Lactarius hatsudake]
MTLSALAWLVAFAMTYGLSPTVPEMPSVGSGKAKVHRRQAEGQRIHSCSTRSARPGAARECPGARAMTSILPSLRFHGVAPACKYLLCDAAVHLHLLRVECRGWPRRLLDVGKAASSTRSSAPRLASFLSPPLRLVIMETRTGRVLQLPLGWPELKNILGATHLPDLNACSAKKEHRSSQTEEEQKYAHQCIRTPEPDPQPEYLGFPHRLARPRTCKEQKGVGQVFIAPPTQADPRMVLMFMEKINFETLRAPLGIHRSAPSAFSSPTPLI